MGSQKLFIILKEQKSFQPSDVCALTGVGLLVDVSTQKA